MSVTLQNATGKELAILVPTASGSQDTVNIAAGASQVLEDAVAARAHGVYKQIADGKLVVTAGAMPTELFTDLPAPAAQLNAANIIVLSSAASAGGAATEALTVTGLLTTDTILAVTQRVKGANSLPLLGYNTVIADGLTGVWSADPGAGAIVDVAIKRV